VAYAHAHKGSAFVNGCVVCTLSLDALCGICSGTQGLAIRRRKRKASEHVNSEELN